MGFYPDVQPGQTYTPSAALENDVRHFFNRLNGFSVPHGTKNSDRQLKVYNASTVLLAAGSIVAPAENGAIIDGAIPVRQYKNGDQLFGVLDQDIGQSVFGSCIISGAIEVAVSGTGTTAAPAADGKSFIAGNGGPVTLLYSFNGRGIVLLGVSSGGTAEYNGYHKITIETSQDEAGNEMKTLKVCDGRTGGGSPVNINGKIFVLESFIAELPYSSNYVFIYVATENSVLTVKYSILDSFPTAPEVKTSEYFLIGRVEKSATDNSFVVYQDFTNTTPATYSTANGVPLIWYRTTRY